MSNPDTRPRLADRWRRARWVVAVAGVVLLAALIAALTVPQGNENPLDPLNAGDEGARAVAQILGDQGVGVLRVTRSEAVAARADADSTLLVTSPQLLGPAQLERIAATSADLVLIEPDAVVLSELELPVTPAGTDPAEARPPGCMAEAAEAAGEARAGGSLYRLGAGAPSGAELCYLTSRGGSRRAGSFVTLEDEGRSVTVIGQSEVLTNRYLATEGNAALALHSLGARRHLVWYLPDPLELSSAADAPTLSELLPSWVRWVALQLAVATGVAMIWQARRLGRLVPEPLPVVVRAAETEQGRARLYRQASARGRAGATLRTAALRRMASRLAVPSGTTPEQLSALAAAAAGRQEQEVRSLLLGSAPDRDADLVSLADDLDLLERDLAGAGARAIPRPTSAPNSGPTPGATGRISQQ